LILRTTNGRESNAKNQELKKLEAKIVKTNGLIDRKPTWT
jgi:hypothetical protein